MTTMDTQPRTPFGDGPEPATTDSQLVERALAGGRTALEELIQRHQPWIYNLAFRMVMVHEEAEDVTQEILIKVITKLGSYDASKSAFRTWLYRIVVNHVINMKSRGYEPNIPAIDSYYDFVDQVPDMDPDSSPETELVISDLAISCTTGVLLCLKRDQRVAFLLTVAFGANDAIGSEVMGISRTAYRQLLSRGRAKLQQFMRGNCSVLSKDGRCKCRNKVTAFMAAGACSAERIHFHKPESRALREFVGDKIAQFDDEVFDEYASLFREHPFYEAPNLADWLREVLERDSFKGLFSLEN